MTWTDFRPRVLSVGGTCPGKGLWMFCWMWILCWGQGWGACEQPGDPLHQGRSQRNVQSPPPPLQGLSLGSCPTPNPRGEAPDPAPE